MRLILCFSLIFFCNFLILAQPKNAYFANFEIQPVGEREACRVRVQWSEVGPLVLFRSHPSFRKYTEGGNAFDTILRKAAMILHHGEQYRTGEVGKADPAWNAVQQRTFMKIPMTLNMRNADGSILDYKHYDLEIGFSERPGFAFLQDGRNQEYFEIKTLVEESGYLQFLELCSTPIHNALFNLPESENFYVDLYLEKPNLTYWDQVASYLSLYFPQVPDEEEHKFQLGISQVHRVDGRYVTGSHRFIDVFRDTFDDMRQALFDPSLKDPAVAVPRLRTYLEKVPSDYLAVRILADHLLKLQREEEAVDLMRRYQSFFAGQPPLFYDRDSLELFNRTMKKKEKRIKRFQEDPNIYLKITDPKPMDLVAGDAMLRFVLRDPGHYLIRVDVFQNGKKFATLREPPFVVPFQMEDQARESELEVRAYFTNETYRSEKVKVTQVLVDEKETTSLVVLQAVFPRESGYVTASDHREFALTYEDTPIEIDRLQHLDQPLNVVILIDSSISMSGKKIYNAQNAVTRFLQRLDAEDQVAIYSFDLNVMQVSTDAESEGHLFSYLQTLMPKVDTSLYDAMLIGSRKLNASSEGVPVLVVISDGDDTVSRTLAGEVEETLTNSSIRLYSIVTKNIPLFSANKLKELSEITGGNSWKISQTDRLNEIFDHIYADLHALHYLRYYGDPPTKRKQLKIHRNGNAQEMRWRRTFMGSQ